MVICYFTDCMNVVILNGLIDRNEKFNTYKIYFEEKIKKTFEIQMQIHKL